MVQWSECAKKHTEFSLAVPSAPARPISIRSNPSATPGRSMATVEKGESPLNRWVIVGTMFGLIVMFFLDTIWIHDDTWILKFAGYKSCFTQFAGLWLGKCWICGWVSFGFMHAVYMQS